MKAMRNVAAVLVVLGLVGSVWAAADGAKNRANKRSTTPPVAGKLEKIDGKVLTVKGKEADPKTLTVDDKTKFVVDGKDATLGYLKVGMQMKAVVEDGVVKSIEAKTPGQNKQARGDKPAKDKPAKEKPAK
jgi:hypothetical protein